MTQAESVVDVKPPASVADLRAILVRARAIKREAGVTLDQAWSRAATEAGLADVAMPAEFRPSLPGDTPRSDSEQLAKRPLDVLVAEYRDAFTKPKWARAVTAYEVSRDHSDEGIRALSKAVGVPLATLSEDITLGRYFGSEAERVPDASPSAHLLAIRLAKRKLGENSAKITEHAQLILTQHPDVASLQAKLDAAPGSRRSAGSKSKRSGPAFSETAREKLVAAVKAKPDVATDVVKEVGERVPSARVTMAVTLIDTLASDADALAEAARSQLRAAVQRLLDALGDGEANPDYEDDTEEAAEPSVDLSQDDDDDEDYDAPEQE